MAPLTAGRPSRNLPRKGKLYQACQPDRYGRHAMALAPGLDKSRECKARHGYASFGSCYWALATTAGGVSDKRFLVSWRDPVLSVHWSKAARIACSLITRTHQQVWLQWLRGSLDCYAAWSCSREYCYKIRSSVRVGKVDLFLLLLFHSSLGASTISRFRQDVGFF